MGRKYRLALNKSVADLLYRDFVALDFETTGLNPKRDKIIEIGAVRYEGGKEAGEYTKLINPERPLDDKITAITHITPDMLVGAPVITDVIGELELFIGNLPIVAHNARFDIEFYKRALKKHRLKNQIIDTLEISRRKLPYLPSRKLTALAERFNIPLKKSHRALDDAKATAKLYTILSIL